MRMWDQHDHLGNPSRVGDHQEFIGQLGGRDDLQPELVAVELERRLHIGDPQHDLSEAFDFAHAAIAATIAARFASFARVGTEQPGARSRPRPPVSAIALRASAATSCGGPYSKLARCPRPPITGRPLIVLPSASEGLPLLWTDQLIACAGMSRARAKFRFEPHRCTILPHASAGSRRSTPTS